MNKKELEKALGDVANAQSIYTRASNEACNVLTAFMMDRGPVTFPKPADEGADAEQLEALEENSEYVYFNSEKDGLGPLPGLIQSVYWDMDIVRIKVLCSYPTNDDGSYREFDCSIEEVINVENVLKFVMRFAE